MESFELRYFLGVAKEQNIHRASENLRVSPASLSKAVSRLEDELGVRLFSRQGRAIRLTEEGQLLQRKASEIIHLEEATKLALSGQKGSIQAVFTGPEIFLSRFALELCAQLQKKFPLATYELNASSEDRAIERIQTGQAHLAFTAGEVPSGLYARTLAESFFYTYVGAGHALYSLAKKKKEVPIEEVLKFPFVSPHRSFLGAVGRKQSNDGWRDDKFPRLVRFKATSLKLVETLVVRGEALAYLPDYFAQTLAVEALKISGCPYSCSQKIKLVARNPEEVSWIRWIYGAAALAR